MSVNCFYNYPSKTKNGQTSIYIGVRNTNVQVSWIYLIKPMGNSSMPHHCIFMMSLSSFYEKFKKQNYCTNDPRFDSIQPETWHILIMFKWWPTSVFPFVLLYLSKRVWVWPSYSNINLVIWVHLINIRNYSKWEWVQ